MGYLFICTLQTNSSVLLSEARNLVFICKKSSHKRICLLILATYFFALFLLLVPFNQTDLINGPHREGLPCEHAIQSPPEVTPLLL